MTEEQIALAKRAVACKGWQWLPGMLIHTGFRMVWVDESTFRSFEARGNEMYGSTDHLLPDLTDPATLGCLLALVREAYPRDRGLVPIDMGDGEWQVILKHERKWSHVVGKSEAEALVAALEAAP
jgi:hypothetical protein